LHQRPHLVGQVVHRQRLQRAAVARPDLGGQALQRRQRARHQPADHQRQRGRHGQQRHHAAQRGLRGALVAHALGLRHLDDAIARLDTEGAPDEAAGGDVGEARPGGEAGEIACGMRQERRQGTAHGPS